MPELPIQKSSTPPSPRSDRRAEMRELATRGLFLIQAAALAACGTRTGSSGAIPVNAIALPGVTINAPSPSAANSSGTLAFSLAYTLVDAVTLTASDITVSTTGTASCPPPSVSGTGLVLRTVTLAGCTGDGTVRISVAAGSASLGGLPVPGAGPSDAADVDNTGPTVTVGAPSPLNVRAATNADFAVDYAGASSITLTPGDLSFAYTGTASGCSGTILGAGSTTRTARLTGCAGDGTVAISVAPGTATDAVGNSAGASTPSAGAIVDNIAPTLLISAPSPGTVDLSLSSVFTLTYSGADTVTLAPGDVGIAYTGSAAGCLVAVGGGDTTTRTVTLSQCSGIGTAAISISSATATDLAGNAAPVAGPSANLSVLNVPPTLALGTPAPSPINQPGTASLTATYTGAAAVTLSASDLSFAYTGTVSACVGAVSGSDLSTRTIAVTGCTGDGTVTVSVAAATATNITGAALAAGPSDPVAIDNTGPAISISAPTPADVRSAQSASFTVTYTDASAITLTDADISVSGSPGVSCAKAVSGSGLFTRTVTFSGCIGDGTATISIAAGSAADSLGNLSAAAGPSAPVNIDNTAPTVVIAAPTPSSINGAQTSDATVTYTGATAVTLAAADITVTYTGNAACAKSVTGSGATARTVTLSGCTGTGTATISLVGGTATDPVGNPAAAAGPSSLLTIDADPPTLVVTGPLPAAVNAALSSDFTVTYTGATAVTLAAADITVNYSGTATACVVTVTGSDAVTRTVSLSGCAGNGAATISIAASTASDSAGNSAAAAGPSAASLTIDNAGPPLAITGPLPASINASQSSDFTVTYTGATAVTLALADLTITYGGSASGCTPTLSGTGTAPRTVTLSGCAGVGTATLSIAAGTAVDGLGNLSPAAVPSSALTIDSDPPTLSISAPVPATVNGAGSGVFTVTYTDATAVTLTAADVTVNGSAGVTCTPSVAGTGAATRTVTLSGCAGDGTATISIAAATASDAAGNPAVAAGPSGTALNVDNSGPPLAITGPLPTSINASQSSDFTVTYAGATAVTLAAADVTVTYTGTAACTKTVSGSGTATRTLTLSACTGLGTATISVASGTASDALGNLSPAAGPGATLAIDAEPPTLTLSAPSVTPISSSVPSSFTVTYAGASTVTLAVADVTVNGTGFACTKTVTGSGTTTRTVTLSACTGDGVATISIAAATATDAAGNPAPAAGPSAAVTIDNSGPTITFGAPSASPISSAGSSAFVVTYNGAATITLAAADVAVTGAGITCAVAVTGSGSTARTVTLSNCAGSGAATISIGAATAVDSLGNLSPAAGPSAAVTIDNAPPDIVITGPSTPTVNQFGSAAFTVTYTGASTVTLAPGNVTVDGAGITCAIAVTGSGAATRTVTLSNCAGNGTATISIAAGTAADGLGNLSIAAGPSPALTVDNTGPSLSITGPSPSDVNSSGSASFAVTYGGADTVTLAAANVTLNVTGTASCAKGVSGTGASDRVVTLSSCTGNGTVTISIAAGTATDLSGNLAPASVPGPVLVVDNVVPTLTIGAPSSSAVNSSGTANFTLTYAGASGVTLGVGNVTLTPTGVTGCTASVSGSGSTMRTVSVTGCMGNGSFTISVAGGTATDLAGNLAAAAGPSATVTVDNVAPTLSLGSWSSATIRNGTTSGLVVTYAGYSAITLAPANITIAYPTGSPTGCSAAVSGSGSTRTITLSGCLQDGTATVSIAAGTATDAAGNTAPAAGPSAAVTIDNSGPTLSIGPPSSTSLGETTAVTYLVTYTGATGSITLDPSDVDLTYGGSTSVCAAAVTGSGATRTITITDCDDDGTFTLAIDAGTATDTVGNPAPSASQATPVNVDVTPPTVQAITALDATPTAAASVTYQVDFSEAVSGVSTADFGFTTTGTIAGASVSGISGSGASYVVTVNTGTGDGTLRLNFVDDDSVTDAMGNPAGGAGAGNGAFSGGDVYEVIKTPPSGLTYAANTATYYKNRPIVANSPTITGSVDYYDVSPALPAGLSIDPDTGVITGTPTAVTAASNFVVTAHQISGTTTRTLTFTVKATFDVEVPIEMLGKGLLQGTGTAISFERSRTTLATTDYLEAATAQSAGSVVVFDFEVIATNTDSSARTVTLESVAPAAIATVSVPANTTAPTRIRASGITPTAGSVVYRVKLDGVAAGQLKVLNARILVRQTAATKTMVYIPLVTSGENQVAQGDNPRSGDASGAVQTQSSGTSFVRATAGGASGYAGIWTYTASEWPGMSTSSAILYEAIVQTAATSGSNRVQARLYRNTSSTVATCGANGTGGTPAMSHCYLSANLTSANAYDVGLRTAVNGTTAWLMKAGIWIRATTNTTQGQVYWQVSRGQAATATTTYDDGRALIDTSLYSNPTVYYETTGNLAASSAGSADLRTFGANDSGGSASSIGSSSLTLSTTRALVRSSSSLSLTNGDRFGARISRTSGTVITGPAFVLIRFLGN